VAGVNAGSETGVCGEHGAQLCAGRECLVPVVLHAQRDARRNAFNNGIEHCRRHAGDDDLCTDRLGELECTCGTVRVGGVEASGADRSRLQVPPPQSRRDVGGVVVGVTEPDLDDGETETRELVESLAERSIPVRIGVPRNPHWGEPWTKPHLARLETFRAARSWRAMR
jgi:hypothetical protein